MSSLDQSRENLWYVIEDPEMSVSGKALQVRPGNIRGEVGRCVAEERVSLRVP